MTIHKWAAVSLLLLTTAFRASAQDGVLDSTFGVGGKVLTAFPVINASGSSTAIQPDGKIVVAGSDSPSPFSTFAVARYETNGTLDTSFGSGGKVVTQIGGNDSATSVAIQTDGRIVVAGFWAPAGTGTF